jgi:hypothetical protein
MQKAEKENVSIVIIGSFNPAIFQPSWFGAQHLIEPEVANAAKVSVIHPEITEFSTDWFRLLVTRDRFQLETASPDAYPLVRDLALGTFELLNHTPVSRIGLNTVIHYRLESETAWHAIGHKLAPKDIWAGILESPGMRVIVMWGQRPGTKADKVDVRVEPDFSFKPGFGIIVAVNHEYILRKEDGSAHIAEILKEEWDSMLIYGHTTAEQLLRRSQS